MSTEAAWAEPFEAWVTVTLAAKGVPGGAIALSRDGRLEYARGFGLRDVESNLPATEETAFGIGSVTKSFTCLAIMQLAEAGKLNVEESVAKYLPQFKLFGGQPAAEITVHHLMTHSAGLPPMPSRHYAALAEMELDEHEREQIGQIVSRFPPHEPIHSYDELITFLAEHQYRLHGAPGQYFSYSNESYALLGAIIERASGQRYEDYVQERILRPAGMTRSSVGLERLLSMDNVTAVYARHNGETYHSPGWFHARAIIPTGQVRSTALDLIRYLEVYRNQGRAGGDRLLSAAGITAMTSGYAFVDSHRSYGYGWIVERDFHGLRAVEHGGGHKGVAAYVGFLPDAGISCAVLTNLAGAPSSQLWDRCLSAALGLAPQPPHQAFVMPAPAATPLAGLTGSYLSEEGDGEINVTLDGDALCIDRSGDALPARQIADDTFVLSVDGQDQEIRFLRDQSGRATHIFSGLRLVPRQTLGEPNGR